MNWLHKTIVSVVAAAALLAPLTVTPKASACGGCCYQRTFKVVWQYRCNPCAGSWYLGDCCGNTYIYGSACDAWAAARALVCQNPGVVAWAVYE